MVWAFFRSMDQMLAGASESDREEEKRDLSVSVVVLAVAAVEAFFNLYFRTLADDPRYSQHRETILQDLSPDDGARPKSLAYKLRNWPQNVLGRSFNWQKGVAWEFNALRDRRNELMHFTSSHETIEVPGLRIQGLADTSCYDGLTIEDAVQARDLADSMLAETFRLAGEGADQVPRLIHLWTGKPPVESC